MIKARWLDSGCRFSYRVAAFYLLSGTLAAIGSVNSIDLQSYVGIRCAYPPNDWGANRDSVRVQSEGDRLIVTLLQEHLFQSAFSSDIEPGTTLEYSCSGYVCSTTVPLSALIPTGLRNPGLFSAIDLLPNGEFVINSVGTRMVRDCGSGPSPNPTDSPVPGDGAGPDPGAQAWKLVESLGAAGDKEVDAYVENVGQGATLTLSCTARDPSLTLSLNLPDVLYRAAVGSIVGEKEAIKVLLRSNQVEYQLDGWGLSSGSLLKDSDPVRPEMIGDLEMGASANLEIEAVGADGKADLLGTLEFSLAGSRNAISQLGPRCATSLVAR